MEMNYSNGVNNATIKLEIPEMPEPQIDLNVLDSVTNDLKPPPQTGSSPALEIGSKNSAFQPYQPLTILTNLQRGNVKTLCRDVAPPHPLTFQEKAAKGSLVEGDINESNVNNLDSDGLSALMWASFHGKLPIVQLLLSKEADVNLVGPEGQTAVMFAASKGHQDVLKLLLSVGADMEIEDEYGNTALIHAANCNHPPCLTELLSHGASMTKTNFIGDNAFDVAFHKGHKACQLAMEAHLKRVLEASISAEQNE